eukprot:TRINITY_DN63339_c0_g1_i1.p1 TRINITY_DN63339_c0_g1~~TRINITY_DN63339_c0_g1_i1.p1  ORF type:complete len:177 (-),score=36.63 TRINITY_DN63339_c0_g1_i1:67-597(-)
MGMARNLADSITTQSATGGTVPYSPPELLNQNSQPTAAGDVWMFGLVVWQMYTGYAPWEDIKVTTLPELLDAIEKMDGLYPGLQNLLDVKQENDEEITVSPLSVWAADADVDNFLVHCLHSDPTQRWSATQLLKHTFVHKRWTKHSAVVTTATGVDGEIEPEEERELFSDTFAQSN